MNMRSNTEIHDNVKKRKWNRRDGLTFDKLSDPVQAEKNHRISHRSFHERVSYTINCKYYLLAYFIFTIGPRTQPVYELL